MSIKRNVTKKHQTTGKDREENRKFMLIVAISTVALILLIYLISR